jgi:DNA topoisomerase III
LGRRFVDNAKVGDHHAIIPTETEASEALPELEGNLYDLVCRRLLAAYHPDHVLAVTQVETEIACAETLDRYLSSGSSVEAMGWKLVERNAHARTAKAAAQTPMLPGGLAPGLPRRVVDAQRLPKTTEPLPHLTDGSLLTAMETAGRTLDDKEMSEAMREKGLGTAATRASILETLVTRAYVYRDGKALKATDKGIALIEHVHPHVKSPAMTGEWEAKLAEIEHGKRDLKGFTEETERYVTEVLSGMKQDAPVAPSKTPSSAQSFAPREAIAEPRTTDAEIPVRATHALGTLLSDTFGLKSFRPAQEEVCAAVAAGKDVLVVMPTGAGKSLCYQLPGLARGGTTLVISPLIALMEDQVAKLAALGLRVARIHSGRDRSESREACVRYLKGELDFLFIAPERLRVSGFPEMLAKRKPTLIAIDEAHCISQWGHDFRPDYRMLGERLPLLRPAPIVALTATATPDVQDDIVKELGLGQASRFIRGFRRDNLAVEVLERSKPARAQMILRMLSSAAQRPAIVYAPTRKESEALAKTLGKRMHAAAYHAGIASEKRDKVQSAFLSGKIDVVVATTAFGMGIDKANVRTVIHAALPATIEGYYQEIGRAGRDGQPARAVLLHGFQDRKTHEFFLERDFPEAADLTKIWSKLTLLPVPLDELRARTRLSAEAFEKAFEKLWVHGGAVLHDDAASRAASPGADGYAARYLAHVAHKREQLEKMQAFASTSACRMQSLVRHFGDRNDDGAACGLCDACKPSDGIAEVLHAASNEEQDLLTRIAALLRNSRMGDLTVGQIHRELGEDIPRAQISRALGGLVRGGVCTLIDDSMVKDGKTIVFQRTALAQSAPEDLSHIMLSEVEEAPRKRPSKVRTRAGVDAASTPKRTRKTRTPRVRTTLADPVIGSALGVALRAFRSSEAKRLRVPAFRVFGDRTLVALATECPQSESALLAVSGVGPALVKRFGSALLALLRTR